MVQTGPKRPRHGGGEMWLTPDPLTPLENLGRKRRSKKLSVKKSLKKPVKSMPLQPEQTPHTELVSTTKELIQGLFSCKL